MLFAPKSILLFALLSSKAIHSVASTQDVPPKSANQTQEIITEILNNRFAPAGDRLFGLKNSSEIIPDIVREIYNGSEKNLNFILTCVKGFTKINISLEFVKSLRQEMQARGHSDPLHLIKLVNVVKSEVLNQVNGNSSKPEARLLVEEMKSDIGERSLEILKPAMLSQSYGNNIKVQNLTHNIYSFSQNLSLSIMQRLVNETFGQIPAAHMADNIYYGSMIIPQTLIGLMILFEKLETTNNTNSEAMIRIAKYINKLKRMIGYPRVSKKKKIAINELIAKLPVCARNLAFSKSLCIWNRGRSEYLYASDGQFYFTRRCVFTCPLDYIGNEGIWNVEEYGDVYYFRNEAHIKEYLYASTTDKYKEGANSRYVETWMDVGFLGETSGWNIELDGDYCYFRNENFKEYMFVSVEKFGQRKRYVFTSKAFGAGDQSYQWQIRNCG